MNDITDAETDALFKKFHSEAQESGYHLNPNEFFTKNLVKSLLTNQARFGYPSCPCRLATGKKEEDLDIICPCDYRDADVSEFGMCYCALYVSQDVIDGKKKPAPIPERRPTMEVIRQMKEKKSNEINASLLSFPVWRCTVCGYLCARNEPPEICPICKAKKERFELFIAKK